MGFVAKGASQAPTSAVADPLDELARAAAKWQTSRIDAYEFRFQHACNALIGPPRPGQPPGVVFQVKDGETRFLGWDGAAAAVPADLVQYSSVERLFAFIRKAWAARPSDQQPGDHMRSDFPAFRMDVQYDQAHGYPTRLCVDPDAIVSDDEFGFLVTDFKVLSNVGDEAKRERR